MPLKVSDGMGAWIKDFQKSDAPQFKGKSDKERRDQAIAAYLSAKRGDKNEDVSELAMKTDPKIPNLKTPKNKKYNRQKPLSTYKLAKKSGEIRKEANSVKSLRVMHPKPASEKPPFEGPYRKAGEVRKDKYGNVIKNIPRHLARKAAHKAAGVNEETNFQVNIEGLPMMFMSGMGPGEIKQKLRKIVKQPSMIQSVKRVTDADVKKTFRLKAQGRDDEEEQMDEAIKYTHVALDSKGKIAGLASKESDSVDMARRHKGKALKLKKPISQKRGNMMVNRAPGLVMGDAYIVRDFNEANLNELSPATMNRYKRKASDDLYRSTNKYTSPISKPRNKKQRDALDKHVDKRKAGLNLVRKRSGTAGYQDESK